MHSKCADLLPKLGVSDLDDLIKVDAAALAAQLRTQRRVVSTEVIEGWQHQARAWTTCDAIRFGTGELEFQRFILLDLEYDCTDGRLGEIWLIGLHVDDGNRRTTQILIEKSSQLSLALKKLESVLAKYSDYPVLTWSGASAELPQLHAIANVPSHLRLLETLEQRHIDVYQLAYRNIRLPVSSYRLKDVAAFFGFKPSSSILDGFEATIKYRQLRRTRSRLQRKRLRGELKSYNRDDLMRLRLVVERFSALKTEPC
jgi:predicted RecB family nuclease